MQHARLALAVLIAVASAPTRAPAAAVDADPIASRIVDEAKQLDYAEEVGRELAEFARGWQTDGGAPLVQQWQAALADARGKHEDGALSDEALAKVEARVIGELAATLAAEFECKSRTGQVTLEAMLKQKTARSITYAQAVFVIGKALGLGVEPVAVTYSIAGEQPALSGHYACLVKLADGATVSVDPSFAPAVSAPFDLATTYRKDSGFYVLADGAKMAGLHRRLRMLDDDGFRAAVLLGRAEDEYNKTHWRTARADAERAVELDAASATARRLRAVLRATRGEYDEAVEDAQKALALDPTCAEAWNTIGVIRLQQDRLPDALEAIEKAIELAPGYAAPHVARSDVHSRQGKWDVAEAEAVKATELAPQDVLVRCWLAGFYDDAGQPEKAIEVYTAAIEIDADFPPAYCKRAVALVGLGEVDEALADCDKVLSLQPDDAMVRTFVGVIFDRADKHTEAMKQYDKAIELDPELAAARYWRTEALRQRIAPSRLRDISVMRGLDKVLELDPRFAQAYASRGRYYLEREEPEKALEDLDTAIELSPRYVWAYAERARVQIALGDFELALEDLDTAIEIRPSSAWCYYERGICHAELGYDEEAVQDWRKAIELDPDQSRWVKQAADEYGLEIDEDD